MDTAGSIPEAQPAGGLQSREVSGPTPDSGIISALKRHFEISLYFLLLTGVLTLGSTGKLGPGVDPGAAGRLVDQGLPMVAREGTGAFQPRGRLDHHRVFPIFPIRPVDHLARAGRGFAKPGTLRSVAGDGSFDAVRHPRAALQRHENA